MTSPLLASSIAPSPEAPFHLTTFRPERDLEKSLVPTLPSLLRRTADYIRHSTTPTRTDRLWPSFAHLFSTNPMSVAYGATGTALFLNRVDGSIPDEATQWMLDRPLDVGRYSPSLFQGLSGIAVAFWELGHETQAVDALRLAATSPLLETEAGMYVGGAGWGWANLYFYEATGDSAYLDAAVRAGDVLRATAQEDDDGLFWRVAMVDQVQYGYGFGSSGIALFLLALYQHTGDATTLDAARRALDYDLAHRIEDANGWAWGRYADDVITLPYWLHGSAGVGTTLIRFYQTLGETDYLDLSLRIAQSAYLKLAVIPSLLEGMSGIGEFMLDVHCATGDALYRRLVLEIAETVTWFRIERPSGVAFPSRELTRVSTDYATGAAGIGLFLERVLSGRPRLFVDLKCLTPATSVPFVAAT